MADVTLTVNHEAGLHARPLAMFVKTAKAFDAKITVTNLTRGKGPVDGTSPVKLMLLAVLHGHDVHISAEGKQADEAIAALAALIQANFAER